MTKSEMLKLLKDKKVQWVIAGILLIVILIWSSSIRFSNWDLLTDQTTGEKIPLALDPFYFLRVSETMINNSGDLPALDRMRYPSVAGPYTTELLPIANVFIYRVSSIFTDATFREVNIASPVIYYILGMILFFFLCWVLTDSKSIAVIASAFLAFIPSYLYRTMAGFSDHEAIGMVAFFATLLIGAIAFKYFDRKKNSTKAMIGLSLGLGLFTALTILSWGGIAAALFIIIPLAMLLTWITRIKSSEESFFGAQLIGFYLGWIVSGILFSLLLKQKKLLSI